MKKIFSLVVLLTMFSITILAKQIDEATARQVGQAFLFRSTNAIRTSEKVPLNLVYKATPSSRMKLAMAPQTKLFYVFNNETKGFIIIAGDDKVTPVLGYSDEGSFNPDSIPENMQAWLEGYREQISYAINNNIEATDEIEKEWGELLNPTTSNLMARANTPVVGPLLTTQWNQSPYVNNLCPFDYTYHERTVTGCVATAMAQIMKYWNHPAVGTGSHSYYHRIYGTLSADFGSTTYEWDSMPNRVNSKNNPVATLMYHCGVSVDMNYGPNSSGAYQSDVATALKNYFKYSSSVSTQHRSLYTDAEWVAMLKNELNASRPIQYRGTVAVDSVGHSFVCDGYDNNGLFHFNWGWGGLSDGYFKIDALNPKSQGTGGSSGGYNFQHEAIIRIQPSTGGYGINIAGTVLTPANAATIDNVHFPNLGLEAGTISYDHSTKTFTLTNVKANVTDLSAQFIHIDMTANNAEYKINLIGNNVITTKCNSVISTEKNLTITGSGSLKITSGSRSGIYVMANMLTIKNTTVDISGKWGIYGFRGTRGDRLVIENSTVKATSKYGSIRSFQDIMFTGCNITQPEGAAVVINGTDGKSIMKDGEIVTSPVEIKPETSNCATVSNLKATVNADNTVTLSWTNPSQSQWPSGCSGNLAFYVYDGTAQEGYLYDDNSTSYTTSVLSAGPHLLGVKIKYYDSNDNSICLSYMATVSVNILSRPMVSNLTATVNADGTTTFNWTNPPQSEWPQGCNGDLNFYFYNGIINIDSNDTNDLTSWTIDALSPGSYTLGVKVKYYDSNGNFIVESGIKIVPVNIPEPPINYGGIKIAGTELTKDNAGAINNSNFPNLGLTSGTITYDYDTRTFTLTDVKANVSSGEFINILSNASGGTFTINPIGTNTINTETTSILAQKNLSIEGKDGSLNLTAANGHGIKMAARDVVLSIKNTKVNVTSNNNYAIKGENEQNNAFFIYTSEVTAQGKSGNFADFKTIKLSGCEITQPVGAVIADNGSNGKAVMLNGQVVTGQVVIKPVTNYGIRIAGTEINAANASYIDQAHFPSLNLKSGTISYDHYTNTITLDNVNAEVTNGNGVFIYFTFLANDSTYTICLRGTNTITTKNQCVMVDRNLNIEGDGSLIAQSPTSTGIHVMPGYKLTIRNTSVNVEGKYGMVGNVGKADLVIENARVKVTGTQGSIFSFRTITLTGCNLTQPEGADVDVNGSNGKAIMKDGAVVTEQVVIEPEKYGIAIAGTMLTSANVSTIDKEHFPRLELNKGTIAYNHATKTITLTDVNANVISSGKNFIYFTPDAENAEYTIMLVGDNVLTNNMYANIVTYKNLTIEGNGSLKVTATNNDFGILVRDSHTLTIKNTKVEVVSGLAIAGYTGTSGEKLVVENATVKATGSNYGSISGFQDITFKGCTITQPAGATIAANGSKGKAVMKDGEVVKSQVVIEPEYYGIRIAGTKLTSANAGAINSTNFPGLGFNNGTITYNHSDKTFTFTNLDAVTMFNKFMEITKDATDKEYAIKLVGKNKITTIDADAVSTRKDLAIEGNGSLQVTATKNNFTTNNNAIRVIGATTLTIRNTTVEAVGNRGIAGETGTSGEKLVIENSTVKVTGSIGSICNFQEIKLTDCKVVQPEGADVDVNGSNGLAVMKDSAVVTEQVAIESLKVNMSRYIELTVTQGEQIQLDLKANAENTPVKVVSGTAVTTLRVGTSLTSYQKYTAQASKMTIYGDITAFDCGENYTNVTNLDASQNTALETLYCNNNQLASLDLSQNTALIELYCNNNQLTSLDLSQNTALKTLCCFDNNLTTQAIDNIYCSLPQHQPADNAKIYPLNKSTDTNHALVLATNKQNAVNKGWRVLYRDDTDIPATTGSYVCGTGIESVESTVSIYPNPVKDILTIKSDNTIESLELYDALGRKVLSQAGESATESTVNVSSLKDGIYILQLRTASGIAKYKVVVSK